MSINNKINPLNVAVGLFDGTYHLGAAALINSLHKSGFEGVIYLITRHSLPKWVEPLKKIEENQFELSENIQLIFNQNEHIDHLGYYKPHAILEAAERFPAAENFFYFDIDILITAKWKFFDEWIKCGIGLCLDCSFPVVPQNHPWRKKWLELIGDKILSLPKTDYYVNTGFVGIQKQHLAFVELWRRLTDKFGSTNSLTQFDQNGQNAIGSDQDILNATMMALPELPYSIIGQEGMGFTLPAFLMIHAVSRVKPWEKQYVKHLINYGTKPSLADQEYLKNCTGPLRPFSDAQLRRKKRSLKFASALGRVIGK